MVAPIAEAPGRKGNSQKELFPDKSNRRDGQAENPMTKTKEGFKRGSSDRRDNPNIHGLQYLRPQFQNQRTESSSRAVKETISHDSRQDTPSHLHRASSRPDIHPTDERKPSSNSIRKADEEMPAYKFVKCRQIPSRVSAKDLFSAFSFLDNPTLVTILRKPTGSSLAFVQFSHSSLAKKTMKELDGTSIGGRSLSLVLAPKVDRERGSSAENWGAEDQRKWNDKEVKRLNKLFENRCNMFTDYFVAFTNDIETQYPQETPLQRKKRVFKIFEASKEKAYQHLKSKVSLYDTDNVQQLMPPTTTPQLVHLEALSLNTMHYSERIANMRLLRIAWQRDIRLPARRYGKNVERLVNLRNIIAHILEGPMTTIVPWDEILPYLRDDLDDVHAAQAESDLEWDSCFDAYIAESQNPNDDHSGVVEEAWYDQGR
ncbi:hypothetical protein BKA61DRAFT_654732 [Leptodontidium sp. MPI-SDFR-AT-0119]|nr:hypothetical protein BKA61DRAFT_654732 [Leptodontidium sp. MPI-SDFR-AT-0119]